MPTREDLQTLEELVALEEKRQAGLRKPDSSIPLGFAKESGKAVLRGAGNFLLGGAEAMSAGPLDPNTLEPIPHPLIEKGREWLDKKLPPQEGTYYRMLEGAGAGPYAGRQAIPMALSGMASAGAGDLADKFLKDQNPLVRKIGTALAGVIAGAGTGYGMGPKRMTTPDQDVQRDTSTLTNLALGRVGPAVDPTQVANQTAEAANRFISGLKRQRSQNFEDQLANVQIRGIDVRNMHQGLLNLARQAPRAEERAALEAVANQLVHADGNRYIRNLQELSLSIKNLKENPPAPSAATGRTISAGDLQGAVRTAEQFLEATSPDFAAAQAVYRASSRTVIDPTVEGPMGRLADRNPNNVAPTPVGRLEAVLSDRSPQGLQTTVGQLQQSGADPQAIARALLQRRVDTGPARPGGAVYGAPGSGQEARVDALLASAGRNPQAVRAPLEAADTLANTLPPKTNATEYVSLHPGGVNLRGIIRPGAFTGNTSMDQYKRQIAELLANANPQELQMLQQLSMFDPKIRAMLTAAGAAAPMFNPQGGQ